MNIRHHRCGRSRLKRLACVIACTRRARGTRWGIRLYNYAHGIKR